MRIEPNGKLKGVVEADETMVGGKYDKRRKRERFEKPCVLGVIQRKGDVRAEKAISRGARAISAFVKASVEPGSTLMTDDYAGYEKVGRDYDHRVINHSKLEYVVGLTHTNSIENFWSLFKRGMVGQFHKVSEKHLDRYLDEFTYRFNGREDDKLFQNTLRNLVNGKTLTFEKLTKTA
jgi:transposase-like protein